MKNRGQKSTETNFQKFGRTFFVLNGSIGGKSKTTGGFASDKVGLDGLTGRERAKIAGSKGGKTSRRIKLQAEIITKTAFEDIPGFNLRNEKAKIRKITRGAKDGLQTERQ